MRQLMVSDAVMARLSALAQDAGESEDQVLRHLLGGTDPGPPDTSTTPATIGSNGDFIDTTYGIRFPEGFQISRTYKGRPFAARVVRGSWVLQGGNETAGRFVSLNQLSQAVIDGNENAWMFWFYQTADRDFRRIAELRDPALVQRRPRRNRRRETAVAPLPLAGAAPVAGPAGKPWEQA